MALEISAADVKSAEEFLASIVSEQVTEGRFTEGTALRDLAIKALSVISAQLRKENNTVQSLQSLLRIKQLAANTSEAELDPAVADAADAILSNWFIYRKKGGFSRGVVNVFVSKKQDYPISNTAAFVYDRNRIFYPDYDTSIVIPASDVRPVTDGSGAITAYVFRLRLIAAKVGTSYDVSPAIWAGTGGFSPFVLRVSHAHKFEGGKDKQTTLEMIESAPNAAAVRNLINDRSIQATLPENFPYLTRMTNIGMGDPEMQRDLTVELASNVRLHVGGHFDIYSELAISESSFTGELGGVYARPDGIINVFSDGTVADWTITGVQVGDAIRVVGGMQDTPRDYPIKEIRTGELYISTRYAFSEATTGISYYIYRPLFGPDVQVYPAVGVLATGMTTSTVENSGRLVLPGEPHYDILDVVVLNPDPGDPYINDPDGLVHFTVRQNTAPVLPSTATASMPFQLVGRNPQDGQSSQAFDEIVLPSAYDGKQIRVSYQTLAGFQAIDSFVRDRFQRVLCASAQPKGYHPIYLSMTIPYSGSVDELRLRQNIVAYINGFDPREVINVSKITTYMQNYAAGVTDVYPFTIQYDLLAPDGRVIPFETADRVAMDPEKLVPGGVEVTEDELLSLTVSDRTVRYLTRLPRILLELR
jgi:hypothetical protein